MVVRLGLGRVGGEGPEIVVLRSGRAANSLGGGRTGSGNTPSDWEA